MSFSSQIDELVHALRRGEIVAYPTETFYGLGVDAHNSKAICRLQKLKERISSKPFPVLVPSLEFLEPHVENLSPMAQALIRQYWPGPLTIILPCKNLPKKLMGPENTVGFRMSSHPIAQAMVQSFGRCITSTSANLSGQTPLCKAMDVEKEFQGNPIVIFQGEDTLGGLPSTIINLATSESPSLVRSGSIPWNEIQTFLGSLSLGPKTK